MKRIVLMWAMTCLIASMATAAPPTLQGRVNDEAKLLSKQQIEGLSALLLKLEKETSNQIVVLTVPTLNGKDMGAFAIETFNAWKLGQAKKDNGVLLVVAQKEHKTWIAVGRGLEGALTDVLCRRILDKEVKPKFRANDYYGGLTNAVIAIDKATHGEFKAEQAKKAQQDDYTVLITILLIIGLILVIMFILWLAGIFDGGSEGRSTSDSDLSDIATGAILGSLVGSSSRYDSDYSSAPSGSPSVDIGGGSDIGGFSGGGGDCGGGGAGGDW